MSDPNQIQVQNLVEGKNSNYFVIKPVDFSLRNSVNYRTMQSALKRNNKQLLNPMLESQDLAKLVDKHRSNSVSYNKGVRNSRGMTIREIIRDLYSFTEEEITAVKKFMQTVKNERVKQTNEGRQFKTPTNKNAYKV
eukprot:TRINITY_DN5427_c0_g2_i8.p1 TRINITY_DN5427_c0_g2~~TRINITY_DN5427_c0_g2_i8.p1  ORF type:complete len:137 (+),score=12.51 TRINITY_DN5427_c0_g2_i8:322-732(+)